MFDRQVCILLEQILLEVTASHQEQLDTNVKLQAIYDEQLVQRAILKEILAALTSQPVATKLVFQLGTPVQQ